MSGKFTHRKNHDGSWDSICMKCFATVIAVVSIRTEEELALTDAEHICDSDALQTVEKADARIESPRIRTTDNSARNNFIRPKEVIPMAVFVQKVWNNFAGVVPEGVSAQLSRTGSVLFVLNAKGAKIASFKAESVVKYWVE